MQRGVLRQPARRDAPSSSQPHPERKSVLIEANALLLADIPGGERLLERAYRQPYAFDATQLVDREDARARRDLVGVRRHRALRAAARDPAAAAAPAPSPLHAAAGHAAGRAQPVPRLPLQLRQAARRADAPARRRRRASATSRRAAATSATDSTLHAARSTTSNRWRLEKKDPGRGAVRAEGADRLLARPQHSREVPRSRSRDGILEWNKAFEKIGFKDAIAGRRSSPTTPTSTRSTRATRRSAG